MEQCGACTHIPAVARQVFDITGAGDTVAATVALGLGAGLEAKRAAALANMAAAIVVGKAGTCTVSQGELLEFMARSGVVP